MALDRLENLLLARLLGDVERNEAASGETHVGDDGAVGAVVEVKEGPRLELELGRPRFPQLAELPKLLQQIRDPLESSAATLPRCLGLHEGPTPLLSSRQAPLECRRMAMAAISSPMLPRS
jgi:hypothetical protein